MSYYYDPNETAEFVRLAAAWRQEDETLVVAINEYIRPGEKIELAPVKFKRSAKSPDYICTVRKDLYDEKEGEILYDTRAGQKRTD